MANPVGRDPTGIAATFVLVAVAIRTSRKTPYAAGCCGPKLIVKLRRFCSFIALLDHSRKSMPFAFILARKSSSISGIRTCIIAGKRFMTCGILVITL